MPKNPTILEAITVSLLPGAILLIFHLFINSAGIYDYQNLPWFDIPMHITGGAIAGWAAWSMMMSAHRRGSLPSLPRWFMLIVIVGSAALIGVVWEFMEYGLDEINHAHLQGGLRDTMKDLLDDLIGGTLFGLIVGHKK